MSADDWKLTRLDVNKWRICQNRNSGDWEVLSPGYAWTPSFVGDSFGDCVSALSRLFSTLERDNRWMLIRSPR